MTENETNLTIEIISYEVWERISQSLPLSPRAYKTATPKNSQWSLFRLHRFAFRRWAFLLVIAVILITTMSWRLKSSHDLGDVIIIHVEKNDRTAIQQLDTINLLYRADNTDATKLSFIGYVKPGANSLRTKLTSFGYSSTIPVRRISTESIFSRLCFNLFRKHIDRSETSPGEIQEEVAGELKKQGVENVKLIITDSGEIKMHVNANNKLNKAGSVDPIQLKTVEESDSSKIKSGKANKGELTLAPLGKFSWMLHNWKTRDSSLNSYHVWIKINDSLYRSFVIRLDPFETIQPGHYLSATHDSVFLTYRNQQWLLQETEETEFKNQDTGFPGIIKWLLTKDGWRFDEISGSLKNQTHLYIDDSREKATGGVIARYRLTNPLLFR